MSGPSFGYSGSARAPSAAIRIATDRMGVFTTLARSPVTILLEFFPQSGFRNQQSAAPSPSPRFLELEGPGLHLGADHGGVGAQLLEFLRSELPAQSGRGRGDRRDAVGKHKAEGDPRVAEARVNRRPQGAQKTG